jgi:hypothetical protein
MCAAPLLIQVKKPCSCEPTSHTIPTILLYISVAILGKRNIYLYNQRRCGRKDGRGEMSL